VTQRTKEIGIRVALGAGAGSVAGLVLKQSLRFATTGALFGVLGALGASRILASQIETSLFDSFDVVACGAVSVAVMSAAAFAAWLPARRASRIEPIMTLRYD
jgi:ABC-type antimicrobial peptide transport system permease subunit